MVSDSKFRPLFEISFSSLEFRSPGIPLLVWVFSPVHLLGVVTLPVQIWPRILSRGS